MKFVGFLDAVKVSWCEEDLRTPHTILRTACCVAALGVACGTSLTTSGGAAPRVESSPELRPGDRWLYEWKSGTESGTKAIEIIEIKEVNAVRYYVARIGETDHFYTLDLRWAASIRDAKVEARMVPPQPWFVWPLEVGRRWTHRGVFEDAERKSQHNDTFAVVAFERIEVPAGRYQAFKIAREADGRDSDVYWYAPEVRWYVKWIGRRGELQFEEQLREHRAPPKLIPQ
jgi:hypothetical protein